MDNSATSQQTFWPKSVTYVAVLLPMCPGRARIKMAVVQHQDFAMASGELSEAEFGEVKF
jgi:hypothetical protein